jgi:serralysin
VNVPRQSRAQFIAGAGASLVLTAGTSGPAVPPCCIDFAAISDRFRRSAAAPATTPPPVRAESDRAVSLEKTRWTNRSELDVTFIDGTALQQNRVERFAPLWSASCSIKFKFRKGADGAIRISFAHGLIAFSAIGNDALTIAAPQPTMNLAQVTDNLSDDKARGLVLHEFGHALGLLHEHQSPETGISWNRAAAYDFFAAKPYYLSPEDVDRQIFKVYQTSETQYTHFDASSIMIYPIPAFLTTNGYGVSMNTALSLTDRSFIKKLYPL